MRRFNFGLTSLLALVLSLPCCSAQEQRTLDPVANRQAEGGDPPLPAAVQLRALEFGPLATAQGWEERSAASAHAVAEEAEQQRQLGHREFCLVVLFPKSG